MLQTPALWPRVRNLPSPFGDLTAFACNRRYIEAGETIDDFIEGFPSVTREQVLTFLEEAKDRHR
jgi:hypothetical protein